MKIILKPEERSIIKPRANKQLNITIFYSDRFNLMAIIHTIVKAVHNGTQFKREEVNENYYEYELKYSKKYNYQERHINGNNCHVFKSKL